MWLVDRGHLGPGVNRWRPARRQGSGESSLVTVRINARSSPSSQPYIGLGYNRPHAAAYAGSQVAGRSIFSVMHRRRGGETRKRGIGRRVVTPGVDQYPSLAAGFRRRALFFEKPSAPIRALANLSGRLGSLLGFMIESRFLHLWNRGSRRLKQPCLRD
jgi:hypothetical protein